MKGGCCDKGKKGDGKGKKGKAKKPQNEAEAKLYQVVTEAVKAIIHLEKEWDVRRLNERMLEYLQKASRGLSVNTKPWNELCFEMADKFFEAFWRRLGDRKWIDQCDYTSMVAAAFKAYVKKEIVDSIDNDENFMNQVMYACHLAYDSCRYYSWGCQSLKKCIQGPKTQKKIREAVDESREFVVKQNHTTSQEFIIAWIQHCRENLAKAGNLHFLGRADAIKLFDCMVQEGR